MLGWAALGLIILQIFLIILTGVFRLGSIELQELLLYINSLIFLGGAGYVLQADAHVRVDIFYGQADERFQSKVNFFGTVFFLTPVLILVWMAGWPYVSGSWRILEGSVETSGLQAVFLLKSFILLFAFLLSLQALALLIRSGLLLFKSRS